MLELGNYECEITVTMVDQDLADSFSASTSHYIEVIRCVASTQQHDIYILLYLLLYYFNFIILFYCINYYMLERQNIQ